MGQGREEWGQEELYGDGEGKPWPLEEAREKMDTAWEKHRLLSFWERYPVRIQPIWTVRLNQENDQLLMLGPGP